MEAGPLATGALVTVLTAGALGRLCPDAPDVHGTPVVLERSLSAGCAREGPVAVGESHIALVFEPHAPELRADARGGYDASKLVTVAVAPTSRIRIAVPNTVERAEDAARIPYFCPAVEHEIGHVTLAYRLATDKSRTVTAHGVTADAAQRAADAAAAALRSSVMREFRDVEDAYDRVSEHGVAQQRAALPFALPATPDIPPCVRR